MPRVAKLLGRPIEAAQIAQPPLECVTQREQVTGVLRRVRQHRRGQRALRPIGLLVLFGELHAGVLSSRAARPMPAHRPTGPRCAYRTAGRHGTRSRGPGPEDRSRHRGRSSRCFDRRGQPDRRKVGDGEGIDQRRLVRGRDLDEVDPVAVAVKTRRLGVHRDTRRAADGGDQLGEPIRLRDVTVHAVSAYSGFASRSMPAAISSSALARVL